MSKSVRPKRLAGPDAQLLSLHDLEARGFGGRTKIYALISRGEFPQPIKIGGNSRWLAEELQAFVAAQREQRDAA